MAKNPNQTIEEKLDVVIELLQYLLAVELSKKGVPKADIRKRLRVAQATVTGMLKGIKEE